MRSSRQRLAQAETASKQSQRPCAAAMSCVCVVAGGWGEDWDPRRCVSHRLSIVKLLEMTKEERKMKAQETADLFFKSRPPYGLLLDQPQESGVKEKSSWEF